jgi:hypothetical protein
MNRELKNPITGIAVALTLLFVISCSKDASHQAVKTPVSPKFNTADTAFSLAAVAPNAFSLWGYCTDKPYLIGTTGICIPVAASLECASGGLGSPNDLAAQQPNGNGQTANGFQFYGCFKGGSNAPDGTNEMSVFITDDVTYWSGDEMGFTETLSDHTLKAYVQTPKPGGGTYPLDYKVLLTNDNGYHTFKCQARSTAPGTVDFYIDGNYVTTVSSSYTGHYYNNYDYVVGTTHRTSNWTSTGQQIEMYNVTTY